MEKDTLKKAQLIAQLSGEINTRLNNIKAKGGVIKITFLDSFHNVLTTINTKTPITSNEEALEPYPELKELQSKLSYRLGLYVELIESEFKSTQKELEKIFKGI